MFLFGHVGPMSELGRQKRVADRQEEYGKRDPIERLRI
jgi:hypothetical protein